MVGYAPDGDISKVTGQTPVSNAMLQDNFQYQTHALQDNINYCDQKKGDDIYVLTELLKITL